jgi:hypothetical protein
MTQIPAGTKFHGVAASVDTRDKKSASRNALHEAFSIEDINNTLLKPTVQTSRTLDVFALFNAVLEDPFDIESWKASFTISEVDGSVLNGVYETSGDFSTETSYANLVGIIPSDDETHKETIYSSAYFTPDSSEGTLAALWETSNVKSGGTFNAEWTYSYEEDASATGSDPKYLHDFRLIVDSLQILGYVVINADDSESHNFIIDSAAG